jgi:hypothetical protein
MSYWEVWSGQGTAGLPNLSKVPVNEGLLAAEEAWSGGIADLGDSRAALVIQQMPGYFDYRGTIEDELRRQLGLSWTMYRAISPAQMREWKDGGDLGPMGFTLSKKVAMGWGNIAAMRGRSLFVIAAKVEPDMVVMRGKEEEWEIVVDANKISYHTLRIVGRWTKARGARPNKRRIVR